MHDWAKTQLALREWGETKCEPIRRYGSWKVLDVLAHVSYLVTQAADDPPELPLGDARTFCMAILSSHASRWQGERYKDGGPLLHMIPEATPNMYHSPTSRCGRQRQLIDTPPLYWSVR